MIKSRTMGIEIGVSIFLLLVLLLLSTIDMAFSQLSDVSLRRISSDAEEEENTRSARFLHEILENRSHFRFALSAAIQILLVVFTVFIALLVFRFYPTARDILIYSLLSSLVLTIIFRQILPRFIVGRNPEKRLLTLLPVMRPLFRLWSFVALPFSHNRKDNQKLDSTIVPSNEIDETDDTDDINVLIQVGEAEGIIEQEERELIERMIEFTDTEVDEIMTPRTEIVALSIDSTVKDARDLIIDKKYSRMPVFRNNIDNIEGFIYVRDLMNNWDEGKENAPIEPLLRPAYFVPETKSAAELLKDMQLHHVQVAIIIDEYGGVAGLVTLEDIVEEIVGEIEDEDIEDEEIIEIIEGQGGGYWDVFGSTEIGKIERVINMEISDDDYTTIAGFVTTEVGHVPKTGDKLNFRGLDVEILQSDEKKVHLLRIRKSEPEVDAELEKKIASSK